ncbi:MULTISPECIES: imelysin family protein [Myroides]|uniref:imelysin family protein n=1 Tax=Myroides TaxID=76831 RepID=UPI0013241608|nr:MULTISPECIES: imelysin family protein [Myroides]MVX34673.1 imelysin [Myroides sp. LoEW2-1]UVD79512.1 imelysin [Myroides albus]
MKTRLLAVGFIILSSIAFSCSSNSDETETPKVDDLYKNVLTDLTQKVITETYKDLNIKATELQDAVNVFAKSSTDENLEKVKKAWVDTRKPWEQSEGFLYGPVETQGLDPAMDTWPVDVEAMNNILKSNQPITAKLISANHEARGFHLIEFLVWGEDGLKKADQLSDRQIEYLVAATEDLQLNTKYLYDAWRADKGNYGKIFISAGPSNNKYPSYQAALEELVDGLFTIADEVGTGKIEEPLNPEGSTPMPEKEESRFSNNSKQDFIDNIISIQNVYNGYYKQDVNGISKIVQEKNAALDKEIKQAITDAINAIDAIPNTFTQAIYKNRKEVKDAQNKVNDLANLLDTKLRSFVNSL